jgi:hypothetical protein
MKNNRSVTHHRAVLCAALNYGIKNNWIFRNTADLAESTHAADREINPLTVGLALAILEYFKGD